MSCLQMEKECDEMPSRVASMFGGKIHEASSQVLFGWSIRDAVFVMVLPHSRKHSEVPSRLLSQWKTCDVVPYRLPYMCKILMKMCAREGAL